MPTKLLHRYKEKIHDNTSQQSSCYQRILNYFIDMPPAALKKRKASDKDTNTEAPSTSGHEESNVVYIGWVFPGHFVVFWANLGKKEVAGICVM